MRARDARRIKFGTNVEYQYCVARSKNGVAVPVKVVVWLGTRLLFAGVISGQTWPKVWSCSRKLGVGTGYFSIARN
eukprot:IDg2153t1